MRTGRPILQGVAATLAGIAAAWVATIAVFMVWRVLYQMTHTFYIVQVRPGESSIPSYAFSVGVAPQLSWLPVAAGGTYAVAVGIGSFAGVMCVRWLRLAGSRVLPLALTVMAGQAAVAVAPMFYYGVGVGPGVVVAGWLAGAAFGLWVRRGATG